MNDLWSELLRRYGVVAAMAAAAAIALTVWSLAHFASAPGTPVKVLWGLVEYTKMPTRPEPATADTHLPPTSLEEPMRTAPSASVEPAPSPVRGDSPLALPDQVEESARGEPTPSRSQDILAPVVLDVSHGHSLDEYAEVVSDLRTRHDLRELRPIESDRPIKASPPGTFFFVHALWLDTSINETGGIITGRASRRRSDLSAYFEAHHRRTGEFVLLAYAAESDADRIRTLTGEQEFQITIAPGPREPFTSLIELPFERIALARPRRLELDENQDLYVLDTTIR